MSELLRNNKTANQMLAEYALKNGLKDFLIIRCDTKELKVGDIIVIQPACYDDLMPYCMQIKDIKYEEKWAVIDAWAFDYDEENIVLRSKTCFASVK